MNNSLFLFATICFIGMVSPGPDFLLVTKNSLIYSRRQALATAFGIITGCLFHATYCILGLALIITESTLLFSIIKYLGAGYLIYLGLKGVLVKHTEIRGVGLESKNNISVWKAYVDGFLCNVLNPKLAVFLLSLFTQFVSMNASVRDKALVASIFVGEAALYWPLLVLILQLRQVRRLFDDFRTLLNRVFGTLLICLGIRVMLSVD